MQELKSLEQSAQSQEKNVRQYMEARLVSLIGTTYLRRKWCKVRIVARTPEPCSTTHSMCSDVFEVAWSAIFLRKEWLACVELAGLAPRTFWGIGAVEVGDMSVANITEPNMSQPPSAPDDGMANETFLHSPVNFAGVLEQAECDRMDWSITPSLIKEATCAIEMVEIRFILLSAEKFHVGNFEVRPEMTS
jgi:hypothetical protein